MDPISVGLGVGGLASNIFTNMANQSNNDRNFELAKRQQDFAERSFRQQMRFNSPVTQANLMRAAGLNPALMNSGLVGSVSAGSSGGMPSTLPMQGLDLSGLSNLSKGMILNDVEKDKSESEVRLNHIKAIADDFNNYLLTTFGEAIKRGELDESVSRTQKNFNEALLALANGDVARAEEKLKKAEEFAAYAKGGRDEAERNYINTEIRWYAAQARSLIRSRNNSAYRDYQEGRLAGQQYDIIDDPDVISAIRQQYFDTSNKLQQEGKLTKQQVKLVDELIDKYHKENNVFYLKMALDYIDGWIKAGADLFALKSKVGALKTFAESSQKNAETRSRAQEFNENSYSTTRSFDAKGNLRGTVQRGRRRR